MSLRTIMNVEGQNTGKVSGRFLAIDAGPGILLEITPNGSLKITVEGATGGVVNLVNGFTGIVELTTEEIPVTTDKYYMTPTDTLNISNLQTDTTNLQTDVTDLQTDTANLQTDVTDIQTQINTVNVPNGYSLLDVNGKILVDQLPNSVMEFKGMYNIITNTPPLWDDSGNAGDVYMCSVAGTRDFAPVPPPNEITVIENDYIIYNGVSWERANNVSYTRAETDALFVFKAGDTMTGDLVVPTLYADKIGNGFNTDILDLTGADLKINKNVDLTDYTITASTELHSIYIQGTVGVLDTTRTSSIQNNTDSSENIALTDTLNISKKQLNLDSHNIWEVNNIQANELGYKTYYDPFVGATVLENLINMFEDPIPLPGGDTFLASIVEIDNIVHEFRINTSASVLNILNAPTINTNSLEKIGAGHIDVLSNVHHNNHDITGVNQIKTASIGWDGINDIIVLNGTDVQINDHLDMNGNNIYDIGTITTTGNISTGATGTLTTNNITCKAINTQNNNLTLGTGTIISTGSASMGALTCTSINTTNGNLTLGTGTITSTGTASVGGLTCTSINTTNGAINTGTGDITTDIVTGNGLRINNNNVIEMGFGVAGKEAQAGKIGYGTFTAGTLDIVGGGTTSSNRIVKLWDDVVVQDNISAVSCNMTTGNFITSNQTWINSTRDFAGGIHVGLKVNNTNTNYNSRSAIVIGNNANATEFDGFSTRLLSGNAGGVLGQANFRIDMKRNYLAETPLWVTVINTNDTIATTLYGSYTYTGLSTGIGHYNSSGLLTSSPIVDGDITVGTIADNKLSSTITNLSTANAIAKRDASGNIQFNEVKLTGNALRNSNNYPTKLIFSGTSTFTGAGTNATITVNVGSIFTSGTYGFSNLNVYTQSAGVNTMYNSSRYDITFDTSTHAITVKPNGANVWTNATNYVIEYFIYDASL